MSRHVRVYAGLALGVVAMGSLLVLARASRDTGVGARVAKERAAQAAEAAEAAALSPPARVFRADSSEPTPGPAARAALARLRAGLSSTHIAERVEAIRQAANRGERQVLDVLREYPLDRDPATTPTRILAVGALAQHLDGDGRDAAVRSLSHWLSQAAEAEGDDHRGQMALIIEVLGEIGGDRAVRTLIDVLQNPNMPLQTQTLAVQSLGRIGAAGARAALDRFRDRLSERRATSEFEAAMVRDAVRASEQAVAKLSRRAAPWQPWTVP